MKVKQSSDLGMHPRLLQELPDGHRVCDIRHGQRDVMQPRHFNRLRHVQHGQYHAAEEPPALRKTSHMADTNEQDTISEHASMNPL